MTHDDAIELLAAHSLDAVDGDERAELEEHLVSCPRCRSELDALREVAGAMGNSVEPLPEGLWSQIASQLPERHEEEEPPPMPSLASRAPTPTPLRAAPEGRRWNRGATMAVAAFAVGAAAVAVVLGIGLQRADDRASNLQAEVGHQPSVVARALATPGHRVVDLYSTSQSEIAQFVVVPDGRGYLVSSRLPSLHGGQTYQLWGVTGVRAVSLGLLGPAPHQAVFTMAGTKRPSRLSITAEPAGGVVAPTTAVVATGTV
jgi:Anti-sigma-K factor rskA/Putative zinc-finger